MPEVSFLKGVSPGNQTFRLALRVARQVGCLSKGSVLENEHSSGDGQMLGWLNSGGELLAILGEGAEVALDLEAVPEGVGLAEEGAEAQRHGRGNGALAVDDLVDRPGSDADGAGHRVLGDAHGLEVFLKEDLSGGDRWVHGRNV